MKRLFFAILMLFAVPPSVSAWNDKGHMVVARLAWQELKPHERTKIVRFLESHPHFEEFLKDRRPTNFSQDEWVFMRAATWADWVKSGPSERRKFDKRPAHYINLPFVQPGSNVNPPAPPQVNVVEFIKECKLRARACGNQEERAVNITWLFHLMGDIHQPLHCFTLFNDDFPNGDKGGNRSLIRVDGRVVQMHSFWDGLLGKPTTRSSITSTVREINTLIRENPTVIEADLRDHQTPEAWAKESFELAKRIAYENGELRPADDDDPPDVAVPRVEEDYAEEAGETARYCAAKAGKRLAQVLREVIDAN